MEVRCDDSQCATDGPANQPTDPGPTDTCGGFGSEDSCEPPCAWQGESCYEEDAPTDCYSYFAEVGCTTSATGCVWETNDGFFFFCVADETENGATNPAGGNNTTAASAGASGSTAMPPPPSPAPTSDLTTDLRTTSPAATTSSADVAVSSTSSADVAVSSNSSPTSPSSSAAASSSAASVGMVGESVPSPHVPSPVTSSAIVSSSTSTAASVPTPEVSSTATLPTLSSSAVPITGPSTEPTAETVADVTTAVVSTSIATVGPLMAVSCQPMQLGAFPSTTVADCFTRCDAVRATGGNASCRAVFVGEHHSSRAGECHLVPLAFGDGRLGRLDRLKFYARVTTYLCYDRCACVDLAAGAGGQQVDCRGSGFSAVPTTNATTAELLMSDNVLGSGALMAGSFGSEGRPGLRAIFLKNCRLTMVGTGTFAGFVNLATLDLSYNRLPGWGSTGLLASAGLARLQLETVDLSFNQFTHVSPDLFDAVLGRNLRGLSLQGMCIRRIVKGSSDRSELPALASLVMGHANSHCEFDDNMLLAVCSCADEHGSTTGDFCEVFAPAQPAPIIASVSDINASCTIDLPALTAALEPPSSLVVQLAVYACAPDGETGADGNCNIVDELTPVRMSTVCCDLAASCPLPSGIATCGAVSANGTTSSVMFSGLATDRSYVTALLASNDAGENILGAASAPFRINTTETTLVSEVDTGASASNEDSGTAYKAMAAALAAITVLAGAMVAMRRYARHRKDMQPISKAQLLELLAGPRGDAHPSEKIHETLTRELQNNSSAFQASTVPEEIPRKGLHVLGRLGSGQFGLVSKAMLSGHKALPPFVVAVKESKGDGDSAELLREAVVMHQFWHPNVLGCIGIVTRAGETAVVMEFSENGDLKHFLASPLVEVLSGVDLLSICANIAQGCGHLHEKGYVHRDLAARNILVSADFIFKICDFGLGRKLEGGGGGGTDDSEDYYRSEASRPFPLRWTAPEAFQHKKYTQSSDIWSWAVLGFEVLSRGEKPYKGWADREVWVRVADGDRLRRPEMCSEEAWAKFFTPCFAGNAAARPTFATLVAKLSTSLGENIHAATFRLLTLSAASMSRAQDWRGTGSTGDTAISLLSLSSGGSSSGQSCIAMSEGGGSSLSRLASISRLTGAVVSHDYAYSPTDSGHGGSTQTLDLESMRGAGSGVSVGSRLSVSKMTGEVVSHDYAYSHDHEPTHEHGGGGSGGDDDVAVPAIMHCVTQGMGTIEANSTVVSEMDLDLDMFRPQSNRVSPAGGFPEPAQLVTPTPVATLILVPTGPPELKSKYPAVMAAGAARRHTVFLEPVTEPNRIGSTPVPVPVTATDSNDDLVAVLV